MSTVFSSSQIDPVQWDKFVAASPQGSIYARHDWASATAPGWQAIIIEEGGVWQAVMPFLAKKKYGINYILQPLFCQTWGPMLAPVESSSTYKTYSRAHKLLDELARAFPKAHLYNINCHHKLSYLLPFHQKQFEINSRYTHLLPLSDEQKLHGGFSSQTKRKLKKSEKAGHRVATGEIESYLELIQANQTAGQDLLGGVKNGPVLLKKLAALKGVSVLICEGKDGEQIAAGMFAMEGKTAYYLGGAIRPGVADEGAMYALIRYALIQAMNAGCTNFDFEGSMIPGIARFFRQFGAAPVPYFSLRKNRLPLPLRWIHA